MNGRKWWETVSGVGGLIVVTGVVAIMVWTRDAQLARDIGLPVVMGLLLKGAYRQAANGRAA